ncbi:hypothetical protein SLA2020_182210 [Shorea laevis]
MANTSKDLLRFEHKNSSTSAIESALLVGRKKGSLSETREPDPDEKLVTAPVPKSQVLGKVKDFLGVISEANKRLELDAKDNAKAYDIEVLTGNESNVIEMDLMLGVADLNTPEAVAAAESAIAGNQPVIPLAASSSETESDDGSDNDDTDYNKESDNDDNGNDKACPPLKLESAQDDSSSKSTKKDRSNKRPRIIELS